MLDIIVDIVKDTSADHNFDTAPSYNKNSNSFRAIF